MILLFSIKTNINNSLNDVAQCLRIFFGKWQCNIVFPKKILARVFTYARRFNYFAHYNIFSVKIVDNLFLGLLISFEAVNYVIDKL